MSCPRRCSRSERKKEHRRRALHGDPVTFSAQPHFVTEALHTLRTERAVLRLQKAFQTTLVSRWKDQWPNRGRFPAVPEVPHPAAGDSRPLPVHLSPLHGSAPCVASSRRRPSLPSQHRGQRQGSRCRYEVRRGDTAVRLHMSPRLRSITKRSYSSRHQHGHAAPLAFMLSITPHVSLSLIAVIHTVTLYPPSVSHWRRRTNLQYIFHLNVHHPLPPHTSFTTCLLPCCLVSHISSCSSTVAVAAPAV